MLGRHARHTSIRRRCRASKLTCSRRREQCVRSPALPSQRTFILSSATTPVGHIMLPRAQLLGTHTVQQRRARARYHAHALRRTADGKEAHARVRGALAVVKQTARSTIEAGKRRR